MKTVFILVAVVLAGVWPASGFAAPLPLHLPATTHNYVVRLTLASASVQSSYGDYQPEAGRVILVFQATWENAIDPAFAASRGLPVSATNDDFSESVSLLIDGRDPSPALVQSVNTANLDPNDPDVVGHSGGSTDASYIRKVVGIKNAEGKRAQSYFALAKPGDRITGDLLFAVPAAGCKSLELIHRDPLGGTVHLPLTEGPPAPLEADPANVRRNEVFALAAKMAEDPATTENPAPPGRRFVAIDFQGKSLLKVKDALPPYDPTHEAGAEAWRPDPAGWVEFRNGVQLVADGALPCAPDPAGDAPETGNFAPEIWTHHRILYLVPAAARSLDLVCYFATYTIPGIEGDVTPKPMRFHLAGPAAAAPATPAKPEAKIQDGPLEFSVARHAVAGAFAGEAAADGEKFLLVDLVLRNTGAEHEEFKVGEQLIRFNHGEEIPPDDLSARGPLTPPAYFGLGPDEARAFQVVWRIPATLKSAEMGLKGNTVAQKFTLPLATR